MRISDWSSDVCSSDLAAHIGAAQIDEGIDPGNAGDHAAVLIGQGHRRLDFAHADPIELAGNTGPDLTGDIGHLTGGVLGVDRRHVASLLIDSIDNVAPLRCMRSEEHTSELQSLMRISYAVFCLKKKKNKKHSNT